jgi:sigma-B regulation protein RsbU (phosphoserine phosphatase)
MRALLTKLGFAQPAEEASPDIHTASAEVEGAEMAVAYFSSRAGGDFYDFVRVSPTRVLFGLLDVAGKREQNRPILVAAQECFRTGGAELFTKDDINESEAMTELARRLNVEIMRAAGGVKSCPAFTGCYNEELGTVCYVNAGHTPGLLRDDSSVVELDATGLPFGLFSLAPMDARIVGIGPQAAMALVSRGVVEAACREEEFGLAGVKHVLRTGATSAQGLAQSVLEQVQEFTCGVPKHNDVTALTLTR